MVAPIAPATQSDTLTGIQLRAKNMVKLAHIGQYLGASKDMLKGGDVLERVLLNVVDMTYSRRISNEPALPDNRIQLGRAPSMVTIQRTIFLNLN